MKSSKVKLNPKLIQNQSVIATLVLISILLGYIAYHFNYIQDFTQNKRNLLTTESVNVLREMHHPIQIVAFASDSPEKGMYFRKSITALINKYQQNKRDISLSFIDPKTDPQKSRNNEINDEGEMIVYFQNRKEKMQLPYTEEAFTNLLLKLQHTKQLKLRFIKGHDEPSVFDERPIGLSKFLKLIKDNGWNIEETIINSHYVHNSHDILVLASPQKQLQHFELQVIHKHLLAGGNMIWLLGNKSNDIEPLSAALGIALDDGIVVDPTMKTYNISQTMVGSTQYANNSRITKELTERTFFPNVRRVTTSQTYNNIWKAHHLIGVAGNGWLSAKARPNESGTLSFDPMMDLKGPINIAVSLERDLNQKQQRILVFGGHEFLNNQNINQGGNQSLITKMLDWAINDYPQVNMKPSPLKDTVVLIPDDNWSRKVLLIIFNGFQFALPLILFGFAFYTWKRKSF